MPKLTEDCPKCKQQCFPNDKPVVYTEGWGDFVVRIWNYECPKCQWTWANALQRDRNAQEYNKQYKIAKFQSGAWTRNR